jgi:hypothetical protein
MKLIPFSQDIPAFRTRSRSNVLFRSKSAKPSILDGDFDGSKGLSVPNRPLCSVLPTDKRRQVQLAAQIVF